MKKIKEKFYSPATNLIFYILLLIATPFLIVQNYLQQVIGMTSRLSFTMLKIDIPYIVAIAIIFVIVLIIEHLQYRVVLASMLLRILG